MNHASLTTTNQVLAVAFSLACPLVFAGTEGYLTTSTAAGYSDVGPAAVYAGQSGEQSGINMRESARRIAERDAALQLLQEGRTAYQEGKYSVALEKYRQAWDRVPHAPATRKLQEFIRKSISDASIAVAIEYSRVGRYDDAEQLLLDVLQREPSNARARKELSLLRDPVRNNPALTPEHVKNVDEVNRLLHLAWGYYELGKYDEAYSEFNNVLRIDPYNEAARRGQEAVSKRRTNYYRAAYNSYRAKALAEVDEAWQEQVPTIVEREGSVATHSTGGKEMTEKQVKINEALDNVHIDRANFDKTYISDVVEFLRGELRKNNMTSLNINYQAPSPEALAAAATPAATPASSEDEDSEDEDASDEEEEAAPAPAPAPVAAGPVPEPEVTLSLSDVTLRELLQEVCANANCTFVVNDRGINIYMANDPASKVLERRVWQVPPVFFTSDESEEGGDEEEDAFASTARTSKIDPKKTLIQAGVRFDAKGANAVYNKRLGKLTVVSTPEDLDAVEEAIFEFNSRKPRMVKVTTKFVEVTQTNDEELSFDWVVNPFSVSNDGSTYLGGVNGYNSTPTRTYRDFVTGSDAGSAFSSHYKGDAGWPVNNNGGLASNNDVVTQGLMTGGLRSGSGAISSSSMDALLRGGSASATSADNSHVAPGILSLTGIYDSGSFQMIMRGLSQKQGVDVMNAPSLVLTPGMDVSPAPQSDVHEYIEDQDNSSRIEIVRRFIYPSAFDPPQIPNNTPNNNNNNNNGGSSVPVAAPSNPTEWVTEEVGLVMVLMVQPELSDNIVRFGRFIVRVVDFEGFINYGSPIISGIASTSVIETIVLTDNRIDQPVFSRKMVNTSLALYDGYTVAIGGMIEDKVQKVEDKVPVFGDLPLVGRFFRSNAESHTRKNLTIFVTADIIDSTGKPVRSVAEDAASASQSAAAPGLFPEDGLVTP